MFTPSEVLRRFPDAIERTYAAGQIVLYHGDQPTNIMIVKKGAIKFFDTDVDGNEKILHIGGEGSIAPLFYSFEDKDAVDAFYATICRTEVILVSLKRFREELQNDAKYAFNALRWYAAEMDHIVMRLKSLEKSTAREKILRALYYLSDQHTSGPVKKAGWYQINFPVTQQTLADLTGLTRETVNITLNDDSFKKFLHSKHRRFIEINKTAIASELGDS